MLKVAIFDLGGVYFTNGNEIFLQSLSGRLKIPLNKLYPLFREGKSRDYRANRISGKEFFEYAAKELGERISPEELNRLWVSSYTEIPETRELVILLKKKGIRVMGLSGNVPERVEYLENKYHFKKLFAELILSYEVNLTKDSPAIYELAIKRSGVKPGEIVFVDDNEANLAIANKLGMETILFNDAKQLTSKIEGMLPV